MQAPFPILSAVPVASELVEDRALYNAVCSPASTISSFSEGTVLPAGGRQGFGRHSLVLVFITLS